MEPLKTITRGAGDETDTVRDRPPEQPNRGGGWDPVDPREDNAVAPVQMRVDIRRSGSWTL
jgi:hypothetical protein